MGRAEKLKKIRYTGLVLMLVGTVIGLLVFTAPPLSPVFMTYFTTGTAIFIVGSLLFMVFYMTAQTINGIGGATVMDPLYAGTFGLTIGMSAALGIEFSKDLE